MRNTETIYGTYEPDMFLGDFHIHGEEDDGRLSIEKLVDKAQKRGLAAIGVTLHDNYGFGDRVFQYVAQRPDIPLRVYPGSEVTATGRDGKDVHVLVYETGDDIKPYQSIPATIKDAYNKGGFAIIAHPDSPIEGSAHFREVLKTGLPVHIEVFNALVDHVYRLKRLLGQQSTDSNKMALETYRTNQEQLGGAVGGSDAHKFKVGLGMTAYRGDFRTSLENRQTVVLRRREIELWYPWDLRIHNHKVADLDAWRAIKYNREEIPQGDREGDLAAEEAI